MVSVVQFEVGHQPTNPRRVLFSLSQSDLQTALHLSRNLVPPSVFPEFEEEYEQSDNYKNEIDEFDWDPKFGGTKPIKHSYDLKQFGITLFQICSIPLGNFDIAQFWKFAHLEAPQFREQICTSKSKDKSLQFQEWDMCIRIFFTLCNDDGFRSVKPDQHEATPIHQRSFFLAGEAWSEGGVWETPPMWEMFEVKP